MPLLCSKEDGVFKIADNESTSTDEIIETLKNVFDDPDFISGTCILLDLTKHTASKDQRDIIRIAGLLGKYREKIGPRNSVIVSNSLQHKLAQIFSLEAEIQGVAFDIFTDINKAWHWIKGKT